MSSIFPRGQLATIGGDIFVGKSQLGQAAYLEWTTASGTYDADSEPTAARKYVIRVTLAPTVLSFLLPNVPLGFTTCVINRSDSLGTVEVRNALSTLLVTLPPGASYKATVSEAVSQTWNESSGASTVARSSVRAGSFLLQPRSINRFTLWSNLAGDLNVRSSTGFSRCEGFQVVSNAGGTWTISLAGFGFTSGNSYRPIATAVANSGDFRMSTIVSTSATQVQGRTWRSQVAVLSSQTLVVAESTTVNVIILY